MKLPFLATNAKFSQTEKLAFVESLATMLTSSIPILEALESIQEDTTSLQGKKLLNEIIDKIGEGKSLSEILVDYPDTFDSVLVNVIKSGEAAGNLDKVLADSALNIKENIETANNVKSALFYPGLIVLVLTAVSFYSFAFALPKVATIFFDLKLPLPAYSVFILKSSVFIGAYKWFFLIGLGIGLVALYRIFAIRAVKEASIGVLVKIPTIGNFVRLLDLSRFTNTTGLLLRAGVPIIEVLEISKSVVVSRNLSRDIDFVKNQISEGSNLEQAMKKCPKSFPALLRRITKVGEETGSLDEALSSLSSSYSKKFADVIKNLTVILEPVLIIFIAGVVALILLSVITPLYQGIGSLNQR